MVYINIDKLEIIKAVLWIFDHFTLLFISLIKIYASDFFKSCNIHTEKKTRRAAGELLIPHGYSVTEIESCSQRKSVHPDWYQ